MSTNRRAFLKAGALIAVPVAAMAAPAALAADDSAAKLARLEDERAIAGLMRGFVNRFNGKGDCGSFVASAGAIRISPAIAAIAPEPGADPAIAFAADGARATYQIAASVQLDTEHSGASTIEKMARFQGQPAHSHREPRIIAAELERGSGGWAIARLNLA